MAEEFDWAAAAKELAEHADLPEQEESELAFTVPTSDTELMDMVHICLQARFGEFIAIDDDGDLMIEHRGQVVWVCIHGPKPRIFLQARLVTDVSDPVATGVHIAIANQGHGVNKFALHTTGVWQYATLPARVFVPMAFNEFLDEFFAGFDALQDELRLRGMGRVGV